MLQEVADRWVVVYEGNIIRVAERDVGGRKYEKAIRSPGTRTMIYDPKADKILLSCEHRQEIDGYDYRLPGGKVRDRIREWDEIKDRVDVNDLIVEAAKKEVREEAGIEIKAIELFRIQTSGGPTIEWNLYYFVATDFVDLGKQELEVGEEVTRVWVNSEEAVQMCLEGKMKEGRSMAVLLQYLHSIGKI